MAWLFGVLLLFVLRDVSSRGTKGNKESPLKHRLNAEDISAIPLSESILDGKESFLKNLLPEHSLHFSRKFSVKYLIHTIAKTIRILLDTIAGYPTMQSRDIH